MLINWFTVVAQTINFLILVWLLKRFLYKPILDAIDAREKGIAAQLADAVAKQTEAQKEHDDFQHKNEVFDSERAMLFKKATDDATAERVRLFDEARKAADELQAKRNAALETEQSHLTQEIVRWTQKEVFDCTRKTLADLADARLEERMIDVFIRRLRSMTGPDKDLLVAAFKNSPQSLRVRSAFDLPSDQQSTIKSAISDTISEETPVLFETVPELISGIELSANGQKIAWSIADYLTTLEKSVQNIALKVDH